MSFKTKSTTIDIQQSCIVMSSSYCPPSIFLPLTLVMMYGDFPRNIAVLIQLCYCCVPFTTEVGTLRWE